MGGHTTPAPPAEAIGYPVHGYYDELPSSSSPPTTVSTTATKNNASACVAAIPFFLMMLGVCHFLAPFQLSVHVWRAELVSMSWADGRDQNGPFSLGLDLKFKVDFQVTNANLFGLSYDRVVVALGYRGDELGEVILEGGELLPLASVGLKGVVELKGFKVMKHVSSMLVEILDGRLPLEITMDCSGNLKLFSLKSPKSHSKFKCETVVNPQTNEILSQCVFQG